MTSIVVAPTSAFEPGAPLTVPGDKSIAHRALIFAARAADRCTITGAPAGLDVAATRRCVEALGGTVTESGDVLTITPIWPDGSPRLDCGNSGTTMRLMCGLLAGRPGTAVLDGDDSLRSRPMRRVTEPLREMGALISTTDGHAPLRLRGADLHGIHYACPVPSAQVKSAIVLAGLDATTPTTVTLPGPSRDHTERMLAALGAAVTVADGGRTVGVRHGAIPAFDTTVPGDVSSAAFVLGLAAVTGGAVGVDGVGLNPTRTAFLDVLASMGCVVERRGAGETLGEPFGRVELRGRAQRGFTIEGDAAADCVDEIPLLCAVAATVDAMSELRDAAELRVKESDRLATVATGLRALGAEVEEHPDGLSIRGRTSPAPRDDPATVGSAGDHRIALALAVAGCVLGPVTITGWEAAAVSYAEFAHVLAAAGAVAADHDR